MKFVQSVEPQPSFYTVPRCELTSQSLLLDNFFLKMAAKRVHINATEAVPKVVAKFVADKSKEAVQARGEFYIGVSGGSVAKFLGKELPAMEGIQWAKWHVYFCDERLVGFDNDDSTYKLYKVTITLCAFMNIFFYDNQPRHDYVTFFLNIPNVYN